MRQKGRISGFTSAIVMILLHSSGCQPGDQKGWATKNYDDLPGLRHTHHTGLSDEYARIVAERATPVLLAQPRSAVADDENAAQVLLRHFSAGQYKRLKLRLRSFLSDPTQHDRATQLELRQFRREYADSVAKIKAACDLPVCQFPSVLPRTTLADNSWIENWEALVQLARCEALGQLQEDDPDAALEALEDALYLTACLSGDAHLPARVRAAQLRLDLLALLLEVARRETLSEFSLRRLLVRLDGWLSDWPSDSQVWVCERAMGLHLYELVRDGHLASILSERETVILNSEGHLSDKLDQAARNVDHDQYFYLSIAREMIEACERPYCERVAGLARIREAIEQNSESGNDRALLARLLLADFEQTHLWLARDRAACEAVSVLLHASFAEESNLTISPITASPYHVVREQEQVSVWGIYAPNEDEVLRVPLRMTSTLSRRN